VLAIREYIRTPYAVLLCDDEFYTFSGLRSAIGRLDQNDNLVGCVGRCLYFFVDQGRFLMKDVYREWREFSHPTLTLEQRLNEDLPPNKTHMAHYAVMRSEPWVEILEAAYRQEFSSAFVYERLVNLGRSLRGQTVILEDLLWFRSMENRNISTSVMNSPDFLTWAQSSIYSDEVDRYRVIVRNVFVQFGIAPSKVEEFQRRFIEGGVEFTLARKSGKRRLIKRQIQNYLLTRTPKIARTLGKRFLPNAILRFAGWEGFELSAVIKSLVQQGTNFNLSELEFIRSLVMHSDATEVK
jgi:hypothetical protein